MSNEVPQNVAARKVADGLVEFVKTEAGNLTSHGAAIFWEAMKAEADRLLPVLKPKTAEPQRKHPVTEALEQVMRIEELTEEIDDDSEGYDFVTSSSATAVDIGKTIYQTQRVSENQQRALENIETGIRAWVRE